MKRSEAGMGQPDNKSLIKKFVDDFLIFAKFLQGFWG
jgi:hypothetical protein